MAFGCAIGLKKDCGIIGVVIGLIAGLIFGSIANVCWIPIYIIGTIVVFFVLLYACFNWMGGGCKCGEDSQAETENRKKAEEIMKKKMGANDVTKI